SLGGVRRPNHFVLSINSVARLLFFRQLMKKPPTKFYHRKIKGQKRAKAGAIAKKIPSGKDFPKAGTSGFLAMENQGIKNVNWG
ncbi:MAG: hypothetical protein ACE5FF_08460, partial [Saprospiraceae bacterium]